MLPRERDEGDLHTAGASVLESEEDLTMQTAGSRPRPSASADCCAGPGTAAARWLLG